ncbi:MAG: DUF6174 domain-containing protein [Actinomycetota bacterium]
MTRTYYAASRWVACAALAILLSSCSLLRDKEGASRWYEAPRTEYSMTLTQQCFCSAGTIKVKVRGSYPVKATLDGIPIDLKHPTSPLTVDDLFLIIFRAEAVGAEQLDVTYDQEWGYPTDIVIDGSGDTSDDELEIHVTSFEPWP